MKSSLGQIRRQRFVLFDTVVQLPLQRGHLCVNDLFDLVREFTLDVLFQSSEQERSKDFMQSFDDEQSLFFVHLHLLATGIGERGVEPFVERFDRVEDFREDEIEQSPELG